MTPGAASRQARLPVDHVLLTVIAILLCGGLVMLASTSISLADRQTGNPFFYFERQLVAVFIGCGVALVMMKIPTGVWERLGLPMLGLAFVLLVMVLVPGLGRTVNGSTRWLHLAGVGQIQVSEPVRLLLLIYLSGYLVRRGKELQEGFVGFLKPMVLIALVCGLLLAQPDFGASAVLLAITLTMLFVAGARLRDFLLFLVGVTGFLVIMALSSPYRVSRITAFLDPWADPYNSGFQLTQSLIAIGSGEWFGTGLGGSVQKLFYLPEAHTDFVFAVIAEELGLAGSIGLIALFSLLIWRILGIARESVRCGRLYQANLAFGLAIWQSVQVFINIGVNMGVLPTKGLTLPLISYGRSSLVVTLMALGILVRIDYENRCQAGATGRRRRNRSRVRSG